MQKCNIILIYKIDIYLIIHKSFSLGYYSILQKFFKYISLNFAMTLIQEINIAKKNILDDNIK